MRIIAAGISRRGARESNQDSFGIFADDLIFAVADGMGGLEHGEQVSAAAIDAVRQQVPTLSARAQGLAEEGSAEARSALFRNLEALFTAATADLYALSERMEARMGTTLTVAVLAGDRLVMGHVGDTRVYKLRGGEARVLTEDHSVAAARLRRGLMTETEYNESPQRSVLYQSLGTAAEVEPDVLEASVDSGDVLMLCSDGVWGSLSTGQITALLKRPDDPREIARALVDQAIAQGSDDNCTAVVIRVLDVGARSSTPLPEALAASPLFADFQESELRLLSPFISHRDLAAGDVVFREGDPGEEMFILERGAVEVTRQGFPLAQLGPGLHFGELAMAANGTQTTTIKAVTPTRLLVLHRRYLDNLVTRRPDLAARVLRSLLSDISTRLVDFNDRLGRAERALWTHR